MPTESMKVRLGAITAAAAIALGEPAFAELPPQASATVTNAAAVLEARTYAGRAGGSLNYRIYAPERVDSGRRYPLVLFLHGAGERGDDNAVQLQWGVWPVVSYMKEKGIDGYLIAPQCPNGKQWVDTPWDLLAHKMPDSPSAAMALVVELLEKAIRDMPVDAAPPRAVRGGDAGVRRRRRIAGVEDTRCSDMDVPRRQGQCGSRGPFAADGVRALAVRREHTLPRVSRSRTWLLDSHIQRPRRLGLAFCAEASAPS